MKMLHPPPKPKPIHTDCPKCKCVLEIEHDDWEVDSFKVSGYHFDGTAVCKDRWYVNCVNCEQIIFKDRIEEEKQARKDNSREEYIEY
jgi:hypothetical protein